MRLNEWLEMKGPGPKHKIGHNEQTKRGVRVHDLPPRCDVERCALRLRLKLRFYSIKRHHANSVYLLLLLLLLKAE